MRLMDCFFEPLGLTLEYIDTFRNGDNLAYDAVRTGIEGSLAEQAAQYIGGAYSEEQYNMAKFAVVAFIDEAIVTSGWEHGETWQKELLQTTHFQTVKAGAAFFDRLNALHAVNPAERDIREVYYYCLALGFKGKYYRPDDRQELAAMRERTRYLLTGDESNQQGEQDTRVLFPVGYQATQQADGPPPVHRGMGVLLPVGIPILVMLVLFYVFKSKIMEAADYLVSAI